MYQNVWKEKVNKRSLYMLKTLSYPEEGTSIPIKSNSPNNINVIHSIRNLIISAQIASLKISMENQRERAVITQRRGGSKS